MSIVDLADPSAPKAVETYAPIAPRLTASRDHVLPILIVVSLLVHATIMLPSMLRDSADKIVPPPKEIPVEIVQEAPKPPAPKPRQVAQRQEPKPPPPKPQPKAADKPQPKTESVTERMRHLLGAMPAIALPSNSPVGSDEISYAQLVLSKLAKAKPEGRFEHPPGDAGVHFTLGESGDVVRIAIARSSGDKWIDDEAIAMVKRGAPYPPPPPGAEREFSITLRLQSVI